MEKRLYETGCDTPVSKSHEEGMFIDPVDGVYKFRVNGIKIVKRLKKNQVIDLKKYAVIQQTFKK